MATVSYHDSIERDRAALRAEQEARAANAAIVSDITDIKELIKSELPALVAKAIKLANNSDDLRELMGVIDKLGDRAYGKPAQAVDMTATVKHEGLRVVLSGVEQSALPPIDAVLSLSTAQTTDADTSDDIL